MFVYNIEDIITVVLLSALAILWALATVITFIISWVEHIQEKRRDKFYENDNS